MWSGEFLPFIRNGATRSFRASRGLKLTPPRRTGKDPGPPPWAPGLPGRTLFLLDGFGYIFRAYYSRVSFTTRSGIPTGALTVFANMILSLLKDLGPSYMAVVFESRTGNVRSEILPQIKANRPEPAPDFLVQIPFIERLIEGLGIPLLSTDGYEADDTIAALARIWLEEGDRRSIPSQVIVLSADKDLLAMVNDRVFVFDPMNLKLIRPENVREKWGVDPVQIPDLLAITGDTADNIPGVPGIGPKTAAKLLEGGKTIDDLYAHLEEVSGDRIRNLLVEHRDNVFRNKSVTILHSALPLSGDDQSLKRRSPDVPGLKGLLEELEAPGLFARIQKWAPGTPGESLPEVAGGARVSPLPALQEVEADNGEMGAQVPGFPEWGIDFLPGQGLWRYEGESVRFFPLSDSLEIQAWMEEWGRESRAIWCVDQASLFREVEAFASSRLNVSFDGVLAAYLLDPGHRGYTMEEIASRLFVDPGDDRSRMVRQIMGRLWADVHRTGLDRLLLEVEIPLGRILHRMENAGIRIDLEALERAKERIEERISALEKEVFELAGGPFTILSPKQVGEVLYGKLGLPTARKGKTGYSTDEETLLALSGLHPLPEKILSYRQMKKLLSTYVDPIERGRDATGRLHGQFNQTIAATGRLSSSNPNLQNIPARTEVGLEIRRCFVAEEGMRLLSADYSQIELRLLAHFTKDPELLESFARNEDIHARTARLLFGEPVTSETRRKAKTINFGVLYGMSAFSLASDLGVQADEARDFIDRYFGAFPLVGPFFEQILEGARKTGEVRTILGRLRKIPELKAPDRRSREYGERMAINTVLQGSAADLIKKSMVDIAREQEQDGLPGTLLIQVHDELLFEVPQARLEESGDRIRSLMERAIALEVPLVVQVGSGMNWVEAHPG
ncbi:MAG: DNA polymerase I [Leptospirales bacterium]